MPPPSAPFMELLNHFPVQPPEPEIIVSANELQHLFALETKSVAQASLKVVM